MITFELGFEQLFICGLCGQEMFTKTSIRDGIKTDARIAGAL